MKAYEQKKFESGSHDIKHFLIIDSVSPPTRSFQNPLASCYTDSPPLKASDLASSVLNSNFNFSHQTPTKHDHFIKESVPTTDKDRLLRDILVRLNTYKKHWNNVKGVVCSPESKLQLTNPFYYDYLNEKDDFTLKVLIQILYEEIDSLSDFLQQNSLSQKEDYDKMEQRLQEKDSLCSSIVKETLEQKSTLAQYQTKIEESDKKLSGHIKWISNLQGVLQTIFEELVCSKFELSNEKKLEIGNLIKNTLSNMPYFIQESTHASSNRTQDQNERSHHLFSPIMSIKRELTYSDLMDVNNKEGLRISSPNPTDFKIINNENQRKSSPKADLNKILFDNRFSSPHSQTGRQEEDDVDSDLKPQKHRRSFSFKDRNAFTGMLSPNKEAQRVSEEMINMNNHLLQKTKELEESLTQANQTITTLMEEKNSLEPIMHQLRIQKDELLSKIQSYDMRPTNNTNFEERFATFMSEGANDELGKSLNFTDGTQTLKEDLKNVLKVLKDAEEKIVTLNERQSYQTNKYENSSSNFSYDHDKLTSIRRIQTGSLSKIQEGSDFDEEAKRFFDNHIEGSYTIELLQNKLKNSKEIHKMLIKQYQNKVLDAIEKLEDMKGMCNLVLTTNQSLLKTNGEQTPTRIRALNTELERKNIHVHEKIKKVEQEQEVNRLELEELIRQEEFVEEFYKLDQKVSSDNPRLETNNESLIAENQELNEMIKILSDEITSLKSQLKFEKTLNQSYSPLEPPSSTRSVKRLSRESSIAFSNILKLFSISYLTDEKQRPIDPKLLINQNDFYYMLSAQATSLEALLS